MDSNKQAFRAGNKAGIPIGMGYFAVAFSLGITAHNAGFSPFQGMLSSLFTYASAGQYISFTLYAAEATLLQLILVTLVINARYLLMGVALNQKIPEGTPLRKRLLIGSVITDEIFGVTIARPGYINPFYPFGAWIVAVPMWTAGTVLGIVMGNVLPLRLVSALSVMLYGMFLAIIVPPAKKDKVIGLVVFVSFAVSYAMAHAPVIREISAGNRTILLTVLISALAAIAFPVHKKKEGQKIG